MIRVWGKFFSLISIIEKNDYDGTRFDIFLLSQILNINIILLHYRKLPSSSIEGNAYYIYRCESSKKYLLIYSEVFKEKMVYNSIQKIGEYVFEKEDFTEEFIKTLKL